MNYDLDPDKIRAIGEAKADAIREQGFAEAEVLERKASALKIYSRVMLMQSIAKILPELITQDCQDDVLNDMEYLDLVDEIVSNALSKIQVRP